jgi:hypothetical protein
MKLAQTPALLQLPCGDAAEAWLETRRSYLSVRTQKDSQYIGAPAGEGVKEMQHLKRARSPRGRRPDERKK